MPSLAWSVAATRSTEVQTVMNEQPRAAVAGNALLSFFPGVDQVMRERVQMALLFAQRATQGLVDEDLLQDRYDHFRRQLMFLGWDAQAPRESWDPDPRRRQTMDQMLRRISASAGNRNSDVTRWSIDVLRASDKGLLHFEQRVFAQESFMLLTCRASLPGCLDLLLYHERLEQEQWLRGFLFRERVMTAARAELVRFNTSLFDQQFAERVGASLRLALSYDVYELQDAM